MITSHISGTYRKKKVPQRKEVHKIFDPSNVRSLVRSHKPHIALSISQKKLHKIWDVKPSNLIANLSQRPQLQICVTANMHSHIPSYSSSQMHHEATRCTHFNLHINKSAYLPQSMIVSIITTITHAIIQFHFLSN